MRDDDELADRRRRVESGRTAGRDLGSKDRARDRLRVRTALAISGVWGAAYFGFPARQPPPELSAAFFAAVAYLLGTRTPEE